jgi:CheY-like chemotaxis protein
MCPSKALVIDNDGDTLELVSMWLRARGYEVATAGDARAGLKAYSAAKSAGVPFGLVVTDVAMPGMTGLELVKALRDAGETVPALLITAYGDALMRPQAKAAGANGVLFKPFDSETLGRCVKAVTVAGSRFVRSGEFR